MSGWFWGFIVAIFVAVGLSFIFCDNKPPDWGRPYQECLKSQRYTTTTMAMVGKTMVPQIHHHTRCVLRDTQWKIKYKGSTLRIVE